MTTAYTHPCVGYLRPAWAEVDLDAIRHNAAALAATVAPASLCAVVKAGGYGHGAVEVARAALDGGAGCLAVALVEEGRDLRAGGITAPVLVLSEPAPAAMDEVVLHRLTPTLYTPDGYEALRDSVRRAGLRRFAVHVKADTGMHRVGANPEQATSLAVQVDRCEEFDLEGFWTHFAVSDDIDSTFTLSLIHI